MDDVIHIESTKDTPNFQLDAKALIFKISGPSFPENANKTYAPVWDWVEHAVPTISGALACEFYYYYLNSSSKRIVYKILKRLDDFYNSGKDIKIYWIHDQFDDDMLELGEEFADLLKVPFQFVGK